MALDLLDQSVGQWNFDVAPLRPQTPTGMLDGVFGAIPRGLLDVVVTAGEFLADAGGDDVAASTYGFMFGEDGRKWYKEQSEWGREWITSISRPSPQEMGTVANFLYQGSAVIGSAVAGGIAGGVPGAAAAAGTYSGRKRYQELREQGVDENTATWAGFASGATMGAAVAAAPYYGLSLLTQTATGIGINVAAGGVDRFSTHKILANRGYDQVAEHYQMLDGMAIAADAVLGAAFPLAARAWNAKPWNMRDTDGTPSVEQVDSALVGTEQQQIATAMPVIPDTVEGISKQQIEMTRVAEQLLVDGVSPFDLVIDSSITGVRNVDLGRQLETVSSLGDEVRSTDPELSMVGKMVDDVLLHVDDFAPARVADIETRAEVEVAQAEARVSEGYDTFVAQTANEVVKTDPSMRIMVDGEVTTVGKLVEQLQETQKRAAEDAKLLNVATACALTFGE